MIYNGGRDMTCIERPACVRTTYEKKRLEFAYCDTGKLASDLKDLEAGICLAYYQTD